jgi:hypothetical protein
MTLSLYLTNLSLYLIFQGIQFLAMWYHGYMEILTDQCYYCDTPAEYNDVVVEDLVYSVSGVCKKHLRMGLSS